MTSRFPSCHSPMLPPITYVYDRDGNLLGDSTGRYAALKGKRFSAVLGGGYYTYTFTAPWAIRHDMLLRGAQYVAVRCGKAPAWAGQIDKVKLSSAGAGERVFTALGIWAALKYRLATVTPEAGESATSVIQRVLGDLSFISPNWSDFSDSGFDVEGKDFTAAQIQQIITDLTKLGDDNTPPNTYDFNIWQEDTLPVEGSFSGRTTASVRDAHSTSDNSNNEYDATALRAGYTSGYTYRAGMKYTGHGIDRYTKILTAKLVLTSAGEMGADNPVKCKIYGELSANAADFDASWPHDRTLTNKYVTWQPTTWPADGTTIETPDFAEVVQEIVSQAGWSPDSPIVILIDSDSDPGKDTRKQFDSYDGDSAACPQLVVTTGTPSGVAKMFRCEYQPRTEPTLADVDYVIHVADLAKGFEIIQTWEETYNRVRAQYGDKLLTDEAEDISSQNLYGIRENKPADLNAGSDATLAQAENLRDAYLEAHKDYRWTANSMTLNRVYNRWGWPVNPALVRPGQVIALADFPTFERGTYRVFRITKTTYDFKTRRLTISPELFTHSLEVEMQRLKAAT